jgi:hypothetical protein
VTARASVSLEPWCSGDLPLLERLMGDPRMTEHLGGPESPAHAFPNVDNAPSNAICHRLGFQVLEECEVEFPKGHVMACNDWRLDLRRLS